jgi:uncharacterized protein
VDKAGTPLFSPLAFGSDEDSHQEATQWLYGTVCGLVDESDKVFITVTVTNSVSTFSVRVAAGDVGKLIGKQGRNARSLRTIFQAIGRHLGLIFALDIEETADPQPQPETEQDTQEKTQ